MKYPHPDQVRDYRLLAERWLLLTRRIPSMKLSVFAEAGGYPLIVVESDCWSPAKPSVYFSAGIHGDEPAAVEGLIQWDSSQLHRYSDWNWQIFPCLNPWGLERNIRFDSGGLDLNRCYDSRKVPQIAAQISVMKGKRYNLSISLHEDYDARGFYIYEVASARPHWAESLRDELATKIDPDPRPSIDGHPARRGVIRRRINPSMMKGHPEAFFLHFHHEDRTFTLETPSEDSLSRRVRSQRKFLEIAVKKLRLSLVS